MPVKELVPGFSEWVRLTLKRELRRRELTVRVVDFERDAACSLADIQRNAAVHKQVVVWSGMSDQTIFDCPESNWAMRALHDLWHLDCSAEFDLIGELHVHTAVLRGGNVPMAFWPVFHADGAGQSLYCFLTGEFPKDQRAFCQHVMDRNTGDPGSLENAVRSAIKAGL